MPDPSYQNHRHYTSVPKSRVSASPGVEPSLKLGVDERTVQPRNAYSAVKNRDGSISISIPTRQNTVAVGYVRKNGAYSNSSSASYISRNGGRDRLKSIHQPGTYHLSVDHNKNGSTTINVNPDRSLQAIKVQLGGKVYYLEIDKVKTEQELKREEQQRRTSEESERSTVTQREPGSSTGESRNSGSSNPRQNEGSEAGLGNNPDQSRLSQVSTTLANSGSPSLDSASGSFDAALAVQYAVGRASIAQRVPATRRPVQPDSRVNPRSQNQRLLNGEIKRIRELSKKPPQTGVDALEALDDMNKNDKHIRKALRAEVRRAEKVLAGTNSNDPRYERAIKRLERYRDLIADRNLQKFELSKIASEDPLTKFKGEKKAISLRREVFKAFDHKILHAPNENVRNIYKNGKEQFIRDTKRLMDEHKSPLRKGFNRFVTRDDGFRRSRLSKRIDDLIDSSNKPGVVVGDRVRSLRGLTATKAATEIKDLSASEVGEKYTPKKLDKFATRIDSRVKRLESLISEGKITPENYRTKLGELKESRAVLVTKRAELLEEQLSSRDLTVSKRSKLERALFRSSKDVTESYKILGKESEAAEFQKRSDKFKSSNPEIEKTSEVKQARKVLDRAATELAKNPESSYLKAKHELARIEHRIARNEKMLANPDRYGKSSDQLGRISQRLLELRNDKKVSLVEAIEEELQRDDLSSRKKSALAKELNEVVERNELDTLKNNTTQLTEDFKVEQTKKTEIKQRIDENQKKIDDAKNKGNYDVKKFKDLESKIQSDKVKLKVSESRLLRLQQQFNETQIQSLSTFRDTLKEEIQNLRSSGSENQAEQLKVKQKELKKVEASLRAAENTKQHIQQKITISNNELRVARLERREFNLQKQLDNNPSTANRQNLEQELEQVKKSRTEASQNLKASKDTLRQKIHSQYVKAREKISLLRNGNLLSGHELPDGSGSKVSKTPHLTEAEAKRQIRNLNLAFVLVEGLRTTLRADYSAESIHSPLPGYLSLLSEDMGTMLDFTTEDRGIFLSHLAEFTRGGLEIGSVIGGIAAVSRVSGSSKVQSLAASRVGQFAGKYTGTRALSSALSSKLGMRALGHLGTAYYAYSDYSKGQFATMSNEQILGTSGSHVALGAGTGIALGLMGGPISPATVPIGALVGGGVGFVAEAAGVARGLSHLDSEIVKNWEKRSVRDSIEMARRGFIFPEGASELDDPSRDPANYTQAEREQIDDYAKVNTLSEIFSGENKLSSDELEALGFIVPTEGMSQEKASEIGQKNWERMGELIEGRGWYNPARYYSGSHLDQVDSRVANQFRQAHAASLREFEELYSRSMRMQYKDENEVSSWDLLFSSGNVRHNGVDSVNEFKRYAGKIFSEIDVPENLTEEQAEILVEELKNRFPELNQILSHDASRALFINSMPEGSALRRMFEEEFNRSEESDQYEDLHMPQVPDFREETAPDLDERLDDVERELLEGELFFATG